MMRKIVNKKIRGYKLNDREIKEIFQNKNDEKCYITDEHREIKCSCSKFKNTFLTAAECACETTNMVNTKRPYWWSDGVKEVVKQKKKT